MNVDDRLNSLEPRLSWFYIRLLLLIGVSWAIQAAELVLLNFSRVLVTNDIGMGTFALEIFGVSIFVGSMVGGPILGYFADKFGRRIALLVSIVFSLGGLAVSAQAHGDYMLIVGRKITGLGHGGQLSSTFVLVQELAPQLIHGRIVSLLDAFAGIGSLIGLALAYAVAPWLKWRTTYLVVSGLVLYTVVLPFTIPESPRWLASVCRTEEAIDIVKQIERSHIQKKEINVTSVPESSSSIKPSRYKQLVPTIILWTLWAVMALSAYILGTYIPTLVSLFGFNLFATWSSIGVFNIAQVVGSFTAAAVLDTYGPHRSFAVFATLTAVTSIALGHMTWSREIVITVSFLVNALLSACWSCIFTYTPGHFTTAHCSRGMGYVVGFSRFVAVGGCYLSPYIVLMVMAVGIVPSYSYYALEEEDGDNSCTWTLPMNLESSGVSAEDSTIEAKE
ncbi:unnamed protein product [Peronospora belbahrii]|uniref:Major facilitator superfamily (MFS) profile domain-containing protein n=1 Tax=Peronospora belbahrii TaxID=622444 RepID=A0AAU9L8B0_9STRA|nr:unnamed protein product [Peronospora belbahrii]